MQGRTFVEQARRRQIVTAAVEVLAERGYGGASLSAIAEHAGISKGVISYHFAGKEDLLRAVVAEVLTAAAEFMTPRVGGQASATAALRTYVLANLEFLRDHRQQVAALTEVLGNLRPAPGEALPYARPHTDAVAELQKLIEAGQRAGEFRACSSRVAAAAVRAAIDGIAAGLGDRPDTDLTADAGELADLFEWALRAPPPLRSAAGRSTPGRSPSKRSAAGRSGAGQSAFVGSSSAKVLA